MKLKFGLKHYDVIKITTLKNKITTKNDKNTILFYPYTNTITTFFKNDNVNIISTNLDYQVEKIFRDIPKNKIIHVKNDKKKNHMFIIPNQIKEKIVIGSILKLID